MPCDCGWDIKLVRPAALLMGLAAAMAAATAADDELDWWAW